MPSGSRRTRRVEAADHRVGQHAIADRQPIRQPGEHRRRRPPCGVRGLLDRRGHRVGNQSRRRLDDDRARVGERRDVQSQIGRADRGAQRRLSPSSASDAELGRAKQQRVDATGLSRRSCSRARSTKAARTGPCPGASENSPISSGASVARTRRRIDWPTSSLADCSESSGMSVGLATRITTVSSALAPSSRARSGLSSTSPGPGGVTSRPRDVEREEAAIDAVELDPAGAPARRVVRDDRLRASSIAYGPVSTSGPSDARCEPAGELRREQMSRRRRRRRCGRGGGVVRSARLARTEWPTRNDPASTATAAATPNGDGGVRAPEMSQARRARVETSSRLRPAGGDRPARSGGRVAPPAPDCA